MNDFGRVALCGLVSQYNLPEPYGMRNIAEVLNRNVMLQGYRVTSFPEQRPAALRELKDVLRSGVLRPGLLRECHGRQDQRHHRGQEQRAITDHGCFPTSEEQCCSGA